MDKDFIFDGEVLSDYGCIICFFDGNEISLEGGEINFVTIKTPGSDKQTFYTSSKDTPISTTFGICKNPCLSKSNQFSREEISAIYRWLQRPDGYHWFQFIDSVYDDVYFNTKITLTEHYINGDVVGFIVQLVTDSPYGYSKENEFTYSMNANENKISFRDYSDDIGIIYPYTIIVPKQSGTLHFITGNEYEHSDTLIKNVIEGNTIILDGENDYFEGIINPNNFIGCKFPIIANAYKNEFSSIEKAVDSVDFDITLRYRYKRRTGV